MRLESIKHQILFKLGLTRKPNVSHPLPKQFIWDTIYRADGINSFHEFSNTNNFQDLHNIMPQQNYPFWSAKPNKGVSVVSMNHKHRPHRDDRKEHSKDSEDLEDGVDNMKRSLDNIIVLHKKYSKNKQQLQQQQQHQTLPKLYNNDINYQKGATSKNLNQLLYTTNRNNVNHTNKTVNNFTIFKQTKHQQQFHKNSQHSTTAKKTTIHQQQNRRQYEPINQYTNSIKNNIQNSNKNNNRNNNNNDNNVNNSNNHNNNNIIMVQKHLRNNNKYIEEAKKFTYLTDINSSDDSLNNMEYHNSDIDDNNRVVRKPNEHKQQLQQLQHHVPKVETSESSYHHHFNIDTHDDADKGDVHVNDVDTHTDRNIIHDAESDNDDVHEEDDDGHRYHHYSHQHRHENYSPKLDAFDENDDFFGSTQEIITFAEKGKMYKNHRLVEFSHQNNEKPKQKLHVRNAEIHIRIDKISIKNKSRAGSGIKRKRLKIWIFQLVENNYTYKVMFT
ncbi:Inhibin beta chain [Lucilia cuprina]|nr:Inhibin beta chain [Lucilia cuprina]